MALQGVQMPSIAGVYGVKDFREDLRPDGGLGKLAQMAMNLYQFKSGQAQQKEMQDAAQQFQAQQGELQRNWQTAEAQKSRDLQEAQMNAARLEAADKANKQWQSNANYAMNAEYDPSNKGSMIQAQNNIRKMIEEGTSMGKTREELVPLYQKLNGIQADINVQNKKEKRTAALTDLKDMINSGAVDTALGNAAELVNDGTIDQSDMDKLLALSQAKNMQLQEARWAHATKGQQTSDALKKPRLKIKKK